LKHLAAILALIACCCGCASDDKTLRVAQSDMISRQHACLGRMYAERAGRGRSAVNWAVYDYCMAHPE